MMTDEHPVAPAFVDTSVVVRYLIQDIPDQTEQARQIIEEHPRLLVTAVTIAETSFVLARHYNVPRDVVVDSLIALLQRVNIRVHQLDIDIVIQALMLCRPSGRVSFADAMLWASARSAGDGSIVYTFDRRFPPIGITVLSEFPEQA